MAGIGMERVAETNDLILALNSGSPLLKFRGFYPGATDEQPLLTGSADGIGRHNGALQIRSSDGTALLQHASLFESQDNALAALAAVVQEHIHAAPVAVGHRVVQGGPGLRTHQLITPQVVDQLRAATHFAPLHLPQALRLIASAQSIFPSAAHYACFDD